MRPSKRRASRVNASVLTELEKVLHETTVTPLRNRTSFPPTLSSSRRTRSLIMPSSSLTRTITTWITAVKNVLNNKGDSTHPCHSPWVTSNHSDYYIITVIRTRTSPHVFVELADNCQHLSWYAEACEYVAQPVTLGRQSHPPFAGRWGHMYRGNFLSRPSFCSPAPGE